MSLPTHAGVFVSCLLSMFCWASTAVAADPVHSEQWWRQQAEAFIDQIEDDDALGRVLNDFNYVRVRAGDLEGASADAPRINKPQLRVFAHLFIAKHHYLRGDMDACLAELECARPVALANRGQYQIVEAYLDYPKSLELASTFVAAIEDPMYRGFRYRFLVEGLARRGRLGEALDIVNEHLSSKRQSSLRAIAGASASAARVDQVEKVTAMMTDATARDSVWKGLVQQLAREGRKEEARQYIARIADKIMIAQANAALNQVGGKAVEDVSGEDLLTLIEKASTRQEKKILQDVLLRKMLENKDADGAVQAIESMVATIEQFPREPERSKFGNLDDKTAIALARSNYLSVAAILAEQGDLDGGRKALAKGKTAVIDMPDSAGLGKMLVVPKLVQAQAVLGDKEGARETLRTINPLFSTMISGDSAVSCIRSGEVQIGLELAEKMISSKRTSRGMGEVCAELINHGEPDAAYKLLSRIGDGMHHAPAFQVFGSSMITLGCAEQLSQALPKMSTVGQAYACVGAAGVIANRVGRPAKTEAELDIVKFLTIPADSLPEGFSIDRTHVPVNSTTNANPGVLPKSRLLTAVEHFQSHRKGSFVEIENAMIAIYQNKKLASDIVVEAFVFPEEKMARQVHSEIYVKGFVPWYFRKGRVLFFVSLRGQYVKPAREAIQAFLEQRELPETG